ncbi:MAG: transposase [Rikenellaceae bacterium]
MGTKHYDKPFKEQAVKLCKQRGNINAVSRELEVSSSQLSKWCRDYDTYGKNSFPGRGVERLTDEQREIKELRKQLKDKELDLEILKKAIAFFARVDKKNTSL